MEYKKAGVFSEDSLPYLWKWSVHGTSQISLQFLKYQIWQIATFFREKHSNIRPYFQVNVHYI